MLIPAHTKKNRTAGARANPGPLPHNTAARHHHLGLPWGAAGAMDTSRHHTPSDTIHLGLPWGAAGAMEHEAIPGGIEREAFAMIDATIELDDD